MLSLPIGVCINRNYQTNNFYTIWSTAESGFLTRPWTRVQSQAWKQSVRDTREVL